MIGSHVTVLKRTTEWVAEEERTIMMMMMMMLFDCTTETRDKRCS